MEATQETKLKTYRPTMRIITLLILVSVLVVISAGPALAQGGDEISAAFSGIVTTITGIIQTLTAVVGILGVTIWGFAKVARPIFPELSQLTSQYIGQFVIGVVAVYVAATVVESLTGAIGGG